jgi:hypothetical protein
MLQSQAGINLNPYQGLKPKSKRSNKTLPNKAGINLNPYQGLKLNCSFLAACEVLPEST